MNATMSLNSQKSKSSKSKSKHSSSSSSSFTNSASIPVSHSKFNSCVALISDPSDSTCRSKLASMIAHRGRGCPWNWIVPHLPTILASIPAHRSRALFAALCSRAESISLKSELSSVFSRDYAKDPFTAVALAQSLHAPLLRAHMDLLQDTFLRIGTSSSSSTSNTSNSSHSYSLEERNAAAVAYALLFRGASDVQKAFTTLLDECMRNIRSHMHSAFYKTVFRHLFVHASQRVLAIRIPIGRVLDFVLEKDVSDASLLWSVLAALGPRCMIRQSQITAFLLFRCPRSSTAWAAAMRLWLDLPGASSSIWGVLLETSSSSSSMSMSMSVSMSKKEYRLDAVLDLPTRLLTQLVQRAGRCIPESVLCAVEAMTLKRMAFCLLRPHHHPHTHANSSSSQEDSNPHDDEKRMKMLVDDFGLVTTCLLSHEASVSPYTHLFLALAQKARHGGAGLTYGVRSAAQKAVAIVELLVHPRRPPVAIVPQIDLTVEVARMMERQHKRSLVEEMLLDSQGKQEEASAAGQKEEAEEEEAEKGGHSRLQPHAQMEVVAQVEKERRVFEERKEEEAPLAKRPRVEVASSFVQSSAPVVTPVSVVVTSTNTALQIGDNAAAADDEDEDDDMISLDSVDSIGSLGSLDDEA
jgi:hypothetical protein